MSKGNKPIEMETEAPPRDPNLPPEIPGLGLPAQYAKPLSEYNEGSELYVIADEWDGQLEQGDPFKERAEPWLKSNPGKKFRYLSDRVIERRGKRGYTPVYDPKDSHVVQVAGQTLAQIPMHVYEQREKLKEQRIQDDLTDRREGQAEEMARAVRDSGGAASVLNMTDVAHTVTHGVDGSEYRER